MGKFTLTTLIFLIFGYTLLYVLSAINQRKKKDRRFWALLKPYPPKFYFRFFLAWVAIVGLTLLGKFLGYYK